MRCQGKWRKGNTRMHLKNRVSTQKDSRLLKLCKSLRQSPEVAKLQDVLAYLAANKYDVDIEVLKKKIG